ncbi:hypothetical protein DY000_02008239 [Brassica cretica]|uniref:Uncharacterized protein n=1 Tax=Brassica cretica TaxID=69181 RepID=A0ABQ7C7A1_BRACR|nr:hypothetical protein DY000_02008239 [Brassica cretica]
MCTVRTFSNTCQAKDICMSLVFLRWATDPAVELQVAELRPISGSSKNEYTRLPSYFQFSEIGIKGTRTAYNEESQSTQCLMITISIEGAKNRRWWVVATSINPILVGGTHFYFDNECAAGQSYLKSCEEGSTFNPTKYGALKKIERMTLGDLNDYLLKSQPQHGFSSFSCAPSNEENAISYQVAVSQDLQDWDLTQCLQEIVRSTLNFQWSLSDFNFSAIHQSFAGVTFSGWKSEPLDPSQTSIDGRNTSEDGPVKEEGCYGKKPQTNKEQVELQIED